MLLILLISSPKTKSLSEIRQLYTNSISKSTASDNLISYFNSNPPRNEIELAYEGAGRMVRAKHLFFPHDKLATYNKGKELLETALAKAPLSLEIRYLRFSIQYESPSFLGYKGSMQEDRKMLVEQVSSVKDPELKSQIINFLLKEAKVKPEEIKQSE